MSQESSSTRSFASRYSESLSHLEQGLTLLEAGDMESAIAELQMALRYDRENTLAHGNLGLIYCQLGQLDKAASAYRVALDLEPADPWLHRGLGAVYEAKGQLSQAQDEYRRAIELDPGDAGGRYELGNTLLAEKKLEEAVDAFCDALEVDPTLDAARNRLAGIYRGRGMNDAALKQYGIVAQRNRDSETGEVAMQRMALIGQPLWPLARRNPAHTAYEPSLLAPPLGIRWQFDTPGDVTAPLIAFNGVVYAACQVGRAGGSALYALDAVTGEEVWHFTVPGKAVSITSAPAAHDGLVLFGTSAGTLYALDAAVGRVAWQWDTRGAIRAAPVIYTPSTPNRAPRAAGDLVYTGSEDGHLYALDLLTGRERWHLETGGIIAVAPAIAEGQVLLGSGDRRFRAVDARTGAELWSANVGEAIGTPVVLGPTVFVVADEHLLYALVTASGERRWIARFRPLRGSSFSDMAAWDGRLYLSYGNVLAALDIISGQIEWEVPVMGVEALSAPALAGQVLYVATTTPGELYAFDIARGRKRWEHALSHPLTTPPTVTPRIILVGSAGSLQEVSPGRRVWAGKVFALGPLS